jgi:alkanesulfonate monooxygenase SsuD/methylene tetrahydromethanopterin reductase-like flavin-dependent oxidoreductase (luciferase family)
MNPHPVSSNGSYHPPRCASVRFTEKRDVLRRTDVYEMPQRGDGMEFGILFTSHPHHAREPYPHWDVHARVTAEIQAADALGYDTAWVAEHHFSNQYGIMPDVFTYMGYLAAKTSRIRLGTAVVTVPLYEPVRVVENLAFVDILSGGRVMIGLGSGYRPYEFEGFGRDFASRHDMQEEAIGLILELLHTRRVTHQGKFFRSTIDGEYELFPVSVQQPHPPLFMAAGTDRSMAYAARHGFGLMLSTLPSIETLARQVGFYRAYVKEAPPPLDRNPACGQVDVARWVYVAETDEAARRDTEAGIVRHISHFMSSATSGYLGTVSEKHRVDTLNYDTLAATTLVHGSPDTVIARLRALRDQTGLTSLLLHYPPYYGHENTMQSLRLFAERVMPEFRSPPRREAVA